jgi:hypothetical protein
MTIGEDQTFAFITLLPDDIQPSVVGDYDFIASTSSEQLTDPLALQQNFFVALDKVTTPQWTQGLAAQQKQINFPDLTYKVFDKLNLGIEEKDVLTDMASPPQPMGAPMGPTNGMVPPVTPPAAENPLAQMMGGMPTNG